MKHPLPLLFLLACPPSQDTDKSAESTPSDPSVSDSDTELEDAPDLAAEEVVARFEEALDGGVRGCRDVLEAYLEVRDQGDTGTDCPAGGRYYDADRGEDDVDMLRGCTTQTGFTFSGVASMAWVGADTGLDYDVNAGIFADLTVTSPEEEVANLAGECELTTGWTASTQEVESHSVLLGAWEIPWLEWPFGNKVSSVMDSDLSGTRDAPGLQLDGGYAVGSHYLLFDTVTYNLDCADAPTGTLAIRGDEGYWYTLELGTDCDYCGELSYHVGRHDLGEVCMDSLRTILEDTMARLQPPTDDEDRP